jgi:hypothetical protein
MAALKKLLLEVEKGLRAIQDSLNTFDEKLNEV